MRAKTSPQRVVLRSRICLVAAEGLPNSAIAHRWETSRPTVRLWRTRFNEAGPLGSVRGCPAWASAHRLSPRKVRASVEATRHTTPPDATPWRRQTLAHAQGVSHASVARIEDAHRWHPHRIETFKRSKATRCVETLTDVVGVDEQPQVHALDRTHPGVPMKKGRCGPLTHDDKPHGTTCLFAARTVLDGTVIGPGYPRHRHEEWLKFLPVIDETRRQGRPST